MAILHGKNSQAARNKSAVNNSTPKYRKEILLPHFAQRPRRTTQLTTGISWCHGRGVLQAEKKERRGPLPEISRGNQKMPTLKNEPPVAQKTNETAAKNVA